MKNAQINYVHLAEAASVDSVGKVSILGIFDRIFLNNIPGAFPRITVVLSLEVKDTSKQGHKLEIKIADPKGIDIPSPSVSIDFGIPEANVKKGQYGINLMFDINNFNFLHFGIYKFRIILDGNEIGIKDLKVEKREK